MKSPMELALDYLSRRSFSRRELEMRLAAKGFAQGDIDQTIARVLEWGYLDDRRYALAYCTAHRERYSRRQVTEALRSRGIDGEIINGVMQESYSAEDEYRTCLMVARRIWPELLRQATRQRLDSGGGTGSGPDDLEQSGYDLTGQKMVLGSLRDKAGRKLAQKGFPLGIIRAVLGQLPQAENL